MSKKLFEATAVSPYRKKPITVEAMWFTDETKHVLLSWAKEHQMNIQPSFHDDKPCLIIPTLDGEMILSFGDYLVKEPFPTDWRKFYPCKPDIFEKTYEPVPPSLPDSEKAAEVTDEMIEAEAKKYVKSNVVSSELRVIELAQHSYSSGFKRALELLTGK